MGSVERRLQRLEESLAPLIPPEPVQVEELPIERWVQEWLEDAIPESRLKNTTDEEIFFEWLENLPKRATWDVCVGHALEAGVNSTGGMVEALCRIFHALPPYIERWRQLWVEHFPDRERRREFNAEMDRLVGRVKTRENGYAWWFTVQEEYARLRAEYAGWEEEWADFYARWTEECEHPQGNAPMSDALGEEFVRVCFLRDKAPLEAHEQEAVTNFASSVLYEAFDWGHP